MISIHYLGAWCHININPKERILCHDTKAALRDLEQSYDGKTKCRLPLSFVFFKFFNFLNCSPQDDARPLVNLSLKDILCNILSIREE